MALFAQHLRRCKQTPKEVSTELRLKRRDGSTFPAQIITAAASEGEMRGVHFRVSMSRR